MQRLLNIYIGDSKEKGRGVFTSLPIKAGDVIEICPVVVIPKDEIELIDRTVLYDYYFLWEEGCAAMALGYGSLYNHSYSPNVEYIMDFEDSVIIIKSLRDIASNEELTFNYNGDPFDKERIWFDPM
ncbi:MAG TPA: SET domain-containing protein [Saprospiraceae bacterium]|jgi:SET domain-containing protein|nr:SET domain-containing protein-lysine N-methyltransferase [Saprospiraceae bacterium]MBX7178233.1 SET domain-containing protein [Saprospiraceae bacterium]MCB0590759.1 SET domain-containing protein-lysine N-methyltransferase [Saprospiraceae bacterium]MCO6470019.1 SET domain-containing protein-lysine N-methyltransferase [Saprospiraceae bacterium]HMY83809.1 SET domain-containing protein [Saprospiraceae bacterium]